MTTRVHKIVNTVTGKVLYSTKCTIDGNTVTGSINPFPYMHRVMKKAHVRPVKFEETTVPDGMIYTLFVK